MAPAEHAPLDVPCPRQTTPGDTTGCLPLAADSDGGTSVSLTVGDKSVRGVTWTTLSTAGGKVLALLCQIALAWFLVEQDFGLVAMALAVAGFAQLITTAGLQVVLIQRQDRFDQEVGHVFWLALTIHLAIALVLILVAPVAGVLFRAPQVAPLILVIAVATIFFALPTVYFAALKVQLRFGTLAWINFFRNLVRSVSMVIMAVLGFGPYSLVVPLVFAALFIAIASRLAVGRIALGKPNPRRWGKHLMPAFWVSLHTVFMSLISSGTNFVVGLVHGATITGLYFWGFSMSAQTILLLSTNLSAVFFSALAKLTQDVERQYRAVKTACQLMTVLSAPVCVLEAFLARPLIELAVPARWLPAVPVVQWLSLGMVTQPLSMLAVSLLMARGLYRSLALLSAMTALATMVAVVVGAWIGAQAEIACCVGASLFAMQLVAGWVAFRTFGRGWAELARTIGLPLGLLVPANLLGVALAAYTPVWNTLWGPVVAGSVGLLCYAALVWVFLPEVAGNIVLRLKRMLPQIARRGQVA